MSERGGTATVVYMPGTQWEPYITLDEVAKRLGYSPRWVHDRIRYDGLPTHQHSKGAQHRFRWSEVETWWHSFRGAA